MSDENAPRTFNYNGNEYVVPHPDDWDVDVLEAYESEKVVTAVKAILGPQQWNAYKRNEKPKAKDVGDFISAMFADADKDAEKDAEEE